MYIITSGSVVSVSVKNPESIRERLSKLTANERQMACLFDYGEGSFFEITVSARFENPSTDASPKKEPSPKSKRHAIFLSLAVSLPRRSRMDSGSFTLTLTTDPDVMMYMSSL